MTVGIVNVSRLYKYGINIGNRASDLVDELDASDEGKREIKASSRVFGLSN